MPNLDHGVCVCHSERPERERVHRILSKKPPPAGDTRYFGSLVSLSLSLEVENQRRWHEWDCRVFGGEGTMLGTSADALSILVSCLHMQNERTKPPIPLRIVGNKSISLARLLVLVVVPLQFFYQNLQESSSLGHGLVWFRIVPSIHNSTQASTKTQCRFLSSRLQELVGHDGRRVGWVWFRIVPFLHGWLLVENGWTKQRNHTSAVRVVSPSNPTANNDCW